MKIYRDPDTKFEYVFNQEKLKKSYDRYILNHKTTKSQLNEELSEYLHLSEESIRKHVSGRNSPSLIEHIYGYGKFLENERHIFLELKEKEDSFYEKAQDILSQGDFVERCIQTVKSGVMDILSEYAATICFNEKSEIGLDILVYYRKKVDALEVTIMKIHKNEDVVNALLNITSSLKKFVCAYECPGIPVEWYRINPNLRFYSPAFDLMINNPEGFEIAVANDWLDYYPCEKEKSEYLEYFSKLEKDNLKNNYHYNINDFYQIELIYTADLLFKNLIKNTKENERGNKK